MKQLGERGLRITRRRFLAGAAAARIDVPVLDWYKEAALFTGVPVARRGALRPPAGRLSEERSSP